MINLDQSKWAGASSVGATTARIMVKKGGPFVLAGVPPSLDLGVKKPDCCCWTWRPDSLFIPFSSLRLYHMLFKRCIRLLKRILYGSLAWSKRGNARPSPALTRLNHACWRYFNWTDILSQDFTLHREWYCNNLHGTENETIHSLLVGSDNRLNLHHPLHALARKAMSWRCDSLFVQDHPAKTYSICYDNTVVMVADINVNEHHSTPSPDHLSPNPKPVLMSTIHFAT